MSLRKLHTNFVKGSKPLEIIVVSEEHVCNLTLIVSEQVTGLASEKLKVYITTRMLKHLYDKKPAEEYDFILDNANIILKFPDEIYENKNGKRGNFAFVKNIDGDTWFAAIEMINSKCYVATIFRIRKGNYLNNYKKMWSWKGDTPSS